MSIYTQTARFDTGRDTVRDAAPDMLAALRIAREALLYAAAKVLDNPDWQPGEYAHLMQAKEHADRAIAKAEGAAPLKAA